MADDDYNSKLESLRRYIPFLSNMMAELKAKGNREAQYNKIQSLHDMITDTRKKLKLETLKRCEEVLTNIYFKVNPQLKGVKTLPKIDSPRESSTLPGIESPRSTPASPSPPRDIVLTKPVTIPTEKIDSSSGIGSFSSKKSHRPKVDVYSNVVMNNPDKQDKTIIPAKTPDMSKPPISLDDLKTLEDDVQQKIDDATFANASVDDLQEFRKQLELQLRIDSVSTSMSAGTSQNDTINTTVRSSTSPSKKLTCTEDKSKPSTSSPTKSGSLEKKFTKDKEDAIRTNASKDVTPQKPLQKVVKEDASIFGNLLSSIDDKLLEIRKKVEKGPINKEDGGSNTSISSEKSDNKETELKIKNKDKHKHRRSSSEKYKHKTDKGSKERSDLKSKDSKHESSTKKHKKGKKEKHRSREHRSKEKSSKDSKSGDDTLKTDKDKPKIMLLSDILLSNSKASTKNNKSSDASPSGSTAELSKNLLDATKDTKSDADATPSILEKTQTQTTTDSAKPTTVYKRLADKYKPKPKTKPDTDIPDVDKAVSDSIENFMKVSPVKPLLKPFGESISIPGDKISDTVKLQPKNTPIVAEQTPPIQLPDILQKIFSKPLLGDLIPKRLHENAIPLSMMPQNRQPNFNLTKPGALHPPEPPILSPPHRSVPFQPPDAGMRFSNFVSPPHMPEIRPHLEMGRPHALLPTPGNQHGFIPAPPIPPNLPRSFMDYNPLMDMGCGTPRMDFDTPSTPLPDFGSPRVDFEHPNLMRNDQFATNQRIMPPTHHDRPIINCDPRTQKFAAQPQFQRQSDVNMFNNQMVPGMHYYGAQNQMAMLGPEVPLYMPDQAYYQERAWQESHRWGNNRRPGDPRNYKEYREMKERQEREVKAAQEKQKDIKDPRLAPRDGDKDVRDPRLIKDTVEKCEDKNDVSIRDPRLSRGNVEINKKEIKQTDLGTKASEKVSIESTDSKLRPKEKESKFDKMYSQTNKGRSQSRTRPNEDKSDDDESFTSPLDSLYNAGEKGKTGRGYGVQNFKIPRKSRVDDARRRDEKSKEKPSDNIGRKKRVVELSDESSESDTNEVDNTCPPENDSDVESVEEEKIKKNSPNTNVSAENKEQQLISKKTEVPSFDSSRIKVILNKDSNSDLNLWQSSNADDDDSNISNFVSEYDLECQIENKNKLLAEINDENVFEPKTKEPDVQLEEPSSSQDIVETKSVSPAKATPAKPQEKAIATDSSKKNDESCKEDATKMITQTVEADSSKTCDGNLTPQGSVSKSEEPTEQKILAHFFENLLKSNNKKDKKTALFSLIETFSDSFETKEIEKIRKIIKVSDEEEESDGEDKESKSNTEKKDETVIIQDTKKVPETQEEQAVVGSTTEEVPTECTKPEETEISTTQEIPEPTVPVPNPELDAPIMKETKLEESLIDQITNPEKGRSLEPVMVSVGERIKNRKRNSNSAKPRKKGKTELDLLHEDIQDMFIRDGVLTATGKRMCRILKDDPSVLSVETPSTSPEQVKKLRKKPGPKPKVKSPKDEVQNSLKDMRIVIKKMSDDVMKSNVSNVRQLRSRNCLSSYAESDDESQVSIDKDTISLRSRVLRNNYAESDDGQKSFADNETATTEDNDSIRSEIEGEVTTESEEEDNKSQTSDGAPKRVLRRRRGTKWASGIIPKNKKKKFQQSKSIENSPVPSRAPSPEPNVDSLEEADFDKLVEPDKEYYYDFTTKTKLKCKLCKYSGHLLTGHYLKEHPQSEVLCARLAPEVAAEAIKDFELNGKNYENVINVKMSSKYQYCCRVCGFTSSTSPIFFYEHVTTHTGEYRHQCGICEYYAVTGKTMAGHFLSAHPNQEKKAIRRTYTLAIIFGYMCGGCNFLQLKEKSVEDHANIFHLNEKPTVYKINMSTIVDPVLNLFGSPVKEQKALEPKLTDISMTSNDSETTSQNAGDNRAIEKLKRKKPVPKLKDASKQESIEEKKEEKIQEKESHPIPIKKKPGPKSKTMPIAVIEKEKTIESAEVPLPVVIKKKPGPKSKTQKTKPSLVEKDTTSEPTKQSSQTPNKNPAAENIVSSFIPPDVDLFLKDASTRKRRRSLEKLIPDDSTEDLDTIITLSSRSSRAAKEKASAKLKTLMESNEGLSTRKKSDVDAAKKDKDESDITKNDKEDSENSSKAQNKTVESDKSKDGPNTGHIQEMHPPAPKEGKSKNKDQNVFTCKANILEEDAKTIEADRLRKMEELNKSIGSRTSKLDFVDKLSNRLNKEQSGKNTGVTIKQEPKDDSVGVVTEPSRAKTPTMPVLEKEISVTDPILRTPPLTKVSRSPILSKKPVLDEDTPPPQSNVSFRQNKSNSLFSNMIEKLQGKINEAAVKQRPNLPSTETSSTIVERSTTPEVLISIGDLIIATKKDNDILYSCHANDCYVATKDKMVFQLHCKFGHKDLNITSSLCDKCGVVIEVTKDTSLLENLYDHLVFAHSDCLSKASTNLRMRRLSGDKLSVKQEQMEKLASTSSASKSRNQDFETQLDSHLHSTEADTVTATTIVSTSNETTTVETAASAEMSAPSIVSEEPTASEATLELAEDNPFSFKIENVMSLAESEPEHQAVPLPPDQSNEKAQDLPPLKPVPPLTLIGPAKQPAVKQSNHLVVKEARLSATELGRPKKAPKALQKFIDTPGDLYKCPHFYCPFSTNVRTLLERHLKAHKTDIKNMVACVYCDMKTPWEHVPMHIDIRHAISRFSCGYCLYRASLKEYVCLHIEHSHPDKQYLVLSLPQHRSAKKFSVADTNEDCKTLCEPFRCICSYSEDGKKNIKEFLFETEFATHLHTDHNNTILACGFNDCTARVASTTMVNHWAVIHGISTYQCGQCKTSNADIGRMYTHCAQFHQSSPPDILVRLNISKDKELGYTKTAFEKLGHIKKIPQNYLSHMAKKSQRFPKLVYISGSTSSEEPSSSSLGENTTGTTSVTSLLPLTQVQKVKLGHVQPSKLLISNPNLQLVVASTTTGNEKVYLVPSPKISPNKSQTVMSVAPIGKAGSQTSPAIKIAEGKAGKSVVAEASVSETPAALSGDQTISYLLGRPTEPSTTVSSSSSHATIAVLSRSLPITLSSRSSRSLLKTSNSFFQSPSTTVSTFSNTLASVAKPTVTSAINPIPLPSTSNDAVLIPDRSDFAEPIGEGTSSQDSSTGLSEDEILQSAIQSILDADDLSENSALSEALANESDSNTAITSSFNNIVSNIISDSIGDLSQLDPLSTAPPPLVLLSETPKQNESITLTSMLQSSENMLQVEHVEVAGDASEGSALLHEDVDPLNLDPLQSNEDSSPDTQSFDDINIGMDSPPEDPLTITPTFNSDLPSTDDQSTVDIPVAAIDPLEVPANVPADDSATETESLSQNLTHGSRTPMQITDMRRSTSMVSNSDDESDSSASEKGKKRGLIGYQLFRCAYCNLSFSNVHTFKTHVSSAPKCKQGARQFQCVHCEKILKSPQRLTDHIQTHGVQRFACSLCNEKFATVPIVKLHMKNRHNIHHTNLVPLKSDRTNMETDAFMVKPAQANQPTQKEKEAASESPNQAGDENTYNPDQVDSIPIRQIFSTNVKCGKCNYQTKVRVNIVRHLQMHLEEKAVPDTAPVNPVPCLEKNEKMFDKMINLAASSITTGRMGGPNQDKEKEDDHNPEFVPNHRRYVCAAQACSYLCPEEANLKHHLMALHSDDFGFNCAHCKKKIEPAEPEHVIKHLKLHGLHLYKCQYCTFVHHLKHKVEKHISDGHLDAAVKVVTVRSMESEPVEYGTAEEQTTAQQTSAAKFKPWRCCMCKAKCFTKEDIQSHTLHKHDMDTQYKCTLCAFKSDDQNSFRDHFKEKHSSHEIDIIYVYQKVEEELPKEDTNVTPFDTTPLWQRDKPRVRHIRGILFDESSPQPIKSPKKPAKSYSGPGAKASSTTPTASTSTASSPSKKATSTSSAPSTPGTAISNASKNLFDCIDAVARGTADTLQPKTQAAPTGAKEGGSSKSDKTDASTRVGNDEVSKVASDDDSESASGASKEKDASVNRKKDTVEEKGKTGEEKEPKKEVVDVDDAFDSGNDDVIEVKQVTSIIVIDSDSDTEPPKPEEKTDVTPISKDKDSKSKPVAKNKGLKRQGTSDLLQEAVKMAKIEEPDDEDSVMATNCNREHLIAMYGVFGSPHHKQWKCPKCHQFKSKRVADFMFHIFKDFNVYRYKCKACSDLSITYKYMLDHISLHPGFTEDIIEPMAQNVKLETWIHMAIREQSLVILKNSPLMKKRPIVGPTDITCYFCTEKFMSMPECCEHMLYHWVMMPYQCQYCPSEFYTVFDLKHHHKIEHSDLKLNLEPKGPTLAKAIQCIENFKKRPAPESTQDTTSQKKSKIDDKAKSPKGGSEKVLSGVVVNPPKRRRGEPKSSSFTPSPVVPDVIRIDDEDDLVIVTKTEEQVINEDEVFACQACAHMSDTEALIIRHLDATHGIRTKKYHSLSKKKSEMPTQFDMACNICDAVFPELNLRRHFLDSHLENHPFSPYRFRCDYCSKKYLTLPKLKVHFTRFHPDQTMKYFCAVKTREQYGPLSKNKLYTCTMCSYTNVSQNCGSIRAHLRGHLRPVLCHHCGLRCRYHNELTVHHSKEHPELEVSFELLTDVQKEFAETLRSITQNAVPVGVSGDVPVAKNVAKKSTSAPSVSSRAEPEEAEYSYYGAPKETFDLSDIETTFELNGLEYTTTAEQMMKMFNLDPFVDVSDCELNILPLDKS